MYVKCTWNVLTWNVLYTKCPRTVTHFDTLLWNDTEQQYHRTQMQRHLKTQLGIILDIYKSQTLVQSIRMKKPNERIIRLATNQLQQQQYSNNGNNPLHAGWPRSTSGTHLHILFYHKGFFLSHAVNQNANDNDGRKADLEKCAREAATRNMTACKSANEKLGLYNQWLLRAEPANQVKCYKKGGTTKS